MTRISAYERLKGKDQPKHEGDAFSRKHPKMDRVKRAKIFQPFDALRGFSAELDITREREGVI